MAKVIKQWDVWLADFPFEEDASQSKNRPVIVLSVDPLWILSVKVTKHSPRSSDVHDVPITKWKESGLTSPSTARVAKSMLLTNDKFILKLGVLHEDDREAIVQAFVDYNSNI